MTRINDNIQSFFESIGVDPSMVCIDGLDNRGFYTFVQNDDGGRLVISGSNIREFHEWPAGEEDWLAFLGAARKDSRAVNRAESD